MKKQLIFLTLILIIFCICACSQKNNSETKQNDNAEVLQKNTESLQNDNQLSSTQFYNNVLDDPTNAYFTNEAVKIEDLKTMALAGVNSPSAMNSQPWHFTIVNDKEKLENIGKIMKEKMGKIKPPAGMKMGNGPTTNVNEEARKEGKIAPAKADISFVPACIIISCKEGNEYDAGLATTNISQMARLLGYATKIVSSPREAIKTQDAKKEFCVPDDMNVVGVVLIGKQDKSITPDYDGYTSPTVRKDFDEMVSIVGNKN